MTTKDDHSEPTWENQLWHARQMESHELRRHASVSTDNRHRCEDSMDAMGQRDKVLLVDAETKGGISQ